MKLVDMLEQVYKDNENHILVYICISWSHKAARKITFNFVIRGHGYFGCHGNHFGRKTMVFGKCNIIYINQSTKNKAFGAWVPFLCKILLERANAQH